MLLIRSSEEFKNHLVRQRDNYQGQLLTARTQKDIQRIRGTIDGINVALDAWVAWEKTNGRTFS